MLPSFFIAHGSPTLAIEQNEYTHLLEQLGRQFPSPKAVVVFSAHWESRNQLVSEVTNYDTIYDFGGFNQELYSIKYQAKGNQAIARDIEGLLDKNGVSFAIEYERGLDHGAWVVLRLLYPNANIPVIAMSVNPQASPEEHYRIGKALSGLRDDNILIIASGGTVHNLRALNWMGGEEKIDQWATDFDEWLARQLKKWDVDSLFKYRELAPSANLAVPLYGVEHFIPIFYAMGAADHAKKATLLHRSYRYGNLSHSIWRFG